MTLQEALDYIAAGANGRERRERQELFDAGAASEGRDLAAWIRRRRNEHPDEIAASVRDGRHKGAHDRWGDDPPPKDPDLPAED